MNLEGIIDIKSLLKNAEIDSGLTTEDALVNDIVKNVVYIIKAELDNFGFGRENYNAILKQVLMKLDDSILI